MGFENERFGQTFPERRHTNDKQAYEKMSNFTNHQGNANGNHKEISFHPG